MKRMSKGGQIDTDNETQRQTDREREKQRERENLADDLLHVVGLKGISSHVSEGGEEAS